jgi:hypothetical protein
VRGGRQADLKARAVPGRYQLAEQVGGQIPGCTDVVQNAVETIG